MLPREHFIFSGLLGVMFYFFSGWAGLLVFIGGLFTDFDHVIARVAWNHDLNIMHIYNSFRHAKHGHHYLLIFHSFEYLLLLLWLSTIHFEAVFFFIGALSHAALDEYESFSIHGYRRIGWGVLAARKWLRRQGIIKA